MRNLSHIILEMPDLEPWPEPVDGSALLDGVTGVLGRFAVLPQWAPEALALFDLVLVSEGDGGDWAVAGDAG